MSPRRVVRLIVKGRVQGVGFRAFIEDEANLLALDGWVRNRRDGAVEALIAGPAGQVGLLIESARSGPPASRVDAVDVRDEREAEPGSSTKGFSVLPTV